MALKYAKARDHRDEVANFKEVLECSEDVFTVLHERHATNPAVAIPFQAAAPLPALLLNLLLRNSNLKN